MPRSHPRHHIPATSTSIQPIPDNKHHSTHTNHPSPLLNRSNQIIEIINDSSSPPTPRHQSYQLHPLHLPALLNHPQQNTNTTHTMSSDHQRTQYPSHEIRRRPEQRTQWTQPHPRHDPPPQPSHVFHLKHTTVYSHPYAFASNGEPLYLQFGTHAAAEAARMSHSIPAGSAPPSFPDARDDYRHYQSRQPRPYEEDRYEPHDHYQRNNDHYDDNREFDRRVSEPGRREDYEAVRYRHSTGHGGPGPGPGPGPGGATATATATGNEGCEEATEEYGRGVEEESGEIEKRRTRLPVTRTYRDFSHVPSVSGQSEERKRQCSSEDLRAKRTRLNWSDELHTKFLAAVEELGVDKAVPTSIMKLMKVEGLTRENVASHLQKYRGTIKKEKEEEERRLLLKAAAKSVLDDGGGKMTEEEVIKAVTEREESYKAPAKKRGGKDR